MGIERADETGFVATPELPAGEGHDAQWITYRVHLDLFNGKEIPVGLREPSMVFFCAGGEVSHKPEEEATGSAVPAQDLPLHVPHSGMGVRVETLRAVNLSPRQWVHLKLRGRLGSREDVHRLARWYRVEFVGHRQRRGPLEPKTFRKTIASTPPLPDPWRS